MCKRYLGQGFEDEYIAFLKAPKKYEAGDDANNNINNTAGPYEDPDAVDGKGGLNNYDFYRDLTEFLKARMQSASSGEIPVKTSVSFVEPYEGPLTDKSICIGNEKYVPNPAKKTIHVTGDVDLYLTSDQFGFSAPVYNDGWITDGNTAICDGIKGTYPYAKFLKLSKKENRLQIVARCINDTRTIGGSFIWPKIYIGSWNSKYNLCRGVKSHIEDRVDLTLCEIKAFYDAYEEDRDFAAVKEKLASSNILLLKYADSKAIYEWLSIFGTFENYVRFFCFEDFVVEEKMNTGSESHIKIINIIDSLIDDDESAEKKICFGDELSMERLIGELNCDELERMMENVRKLILRRSQRIESEISKQKKIRNNRIYNIIKS